MSGQVFRFKKFTIHQDCCAMKVGTDGVLLGAWAGKKMSPSRILDIGTGTGLMALMLAQRFPNARITAIELDEAAYQQAKENVNSSPFTDRILVLKADVFEFTCEDGFDLIVCNPPFYQHSHPSTNASRDLARQGMSLFELQRKALSILLEGGHFAIILPHHIWEENKLQFENWKIARLCAVRPTPQKSTHRLLLELNLYSRRSEDSELVLESDGRHVFSKEYKSLTRDFYLNF